LPKRKGRFQGPPDRHPEPGGKEVAVKALSTAASTGRHIIGAFVEASLMVAILGALALGVATFTGQPAGAGSVLARSTSSSSIALASVGGGAATVQPSLGSTVTFSTTYPSSTKNPRIEVLCYQSGSLVYGEAGSVTYTFLLGGGGSTWLSAGGAVSCQANLFYFFWKGGQQYYQVLASTRFDAAG
jgi:hypothetical protein